ncbi:DUF6515 family protein [Microbulbifer sediminum]|uniref:DUF6515 family protein n=1 Tax=Microbulbifer sediminum TaxID=2904250 RepID=UPI001F4831BF|nr:DUF6515 family protein [Microbulbifer sediminum]
MKKLITVIATTSLLLAGPALADREGRSGFRGYQKDSQLSGSAFDSAMRKHRRAEREEHREGRRDHKRKRHDRGDYDGDRRGRDRGDYDGDRYRHKKTGRGHDDHRGRGHDKHWNKHQRKHWKKHQRRHWAKHDYDRRHYRKHRHHWRPSRYSYGYRWRHLPSNFVRISLGGIGFFYSDGIFYRRHDHGYVVARPPIGAVVYSLPGAAVSLSFGGLDYYVAYDTFYRWDHRHRGYRVVENPGFY